MASPYAPVITATGITANDYAQNLALLQADFLSIYGSDTYLGNDSQDGQWLGTLAQAFTDFGAACVAVYNAFSPATAQGNGLSSGVKINGLKRLVPTASTATVTLTGVANKTLINAQCIDTAGYVWALPASVTIGSGGTVSVLATCTTLGAIAAAIGAINGINTPLYGWQSVTNAAAATLGNPVETDAALRIRQAGSVSTPSQTIFEGIVASLENLQGVTRVRGYENNTNATVNGVNAASLYFIVEGTATPNAVASTIALKQTPGVPTQGSISTTITDSFGSTRVIKYDAPSEVTLTMVVTITPLNGWSSATKAVIQAALTTYALALPIGTNVSWTSMIVAAYLPGTAYAGTFLVTGLTINGSSADLALSIAQAPTTSPATITFSGV